MYLKEVIEATLIGYAAILVMATFVVLPELNDNILFAIVGGTSAGLLLAELIFD